MKILSIALLLLLALLSAAAVLLMLTGVISRVLREKSRRGRSRGSGQRAQEEIVPSHMAAEYYGDVERFRDSPTKQLLEKGLSLKQKAGFAKAADKLSMFPQADLTPQQEIGRLVSIGNYYLAANKYRQARDRYEKAKDLAAQSGDERGKLASLINLGLVSAAEMKWDEAITFYQQAIALDRSLGYSRGEAIDLNTLALLQENRGDLNSALTHYSASVEIFRKLKDVEKTELVERNIKRIRTLAKKTST
jgi:tetratricopeptide (TPR) repeat protein